MEWTENLSRQKDHSNRNYVLINLPGKEVRVADVTWDKNEEELVRESGE